MADRRAYAGLSWLFATAVADAFISGVLTFALVRNRTGFNTPTDGVLRKVLQLGSLFDTG